MGARSVFWVCLFAACTPALPAHEPSMFFGDVALGESRTVALTLTTRAPQRLTFQILEGDYSVDESSRALAANETTTLLVRFTPTELGARGGRLAINGEELSLSGRGTGARISAPARLYPGPFALIGGQPEKTEHAVLLMRNLGTAGSPLRLGPPRVDGSELCIGDFVGETCQPWQPPDGLDTETLLQVPLAFRVKTAGPHQWSLVFPSNDFLFPELTVEVFAFVEALEPCVFAPTEVVFQANTTAALQLTHTGPGTCLIRELSLSPADALAFAPAPRLPARLQQGETLVAAIALRPQAPSELQGFVHVVAALTAPFDVPVRRAPANCLVVNPSTVDFGTLARGCSSVPRGVQVYNTCSSPLTLGGVSLFATGGEPAGTAGCPGPSPCPEFFVGSAPAAGTVLSPGAAPLTFSVTYRPAGLDVDNGAVKIETLEGMNAVLGLRGISAPPPYNVDSFRQDTSVTRRTFYLTGLPELPLVLAIDGQPVPSADWTYDPALNAVTFVLGREPAPGQTLTISYQTTCTP